MDGMVCYRSKHCYAKSIAPHQFCNNATGDAMLRRLSCAALPPSRGDMTSCSQWNNCLVCPAVRLSGLDRVQQSQSFLRLPLPSLGFYYIIIFLLLLIDLALSRDFSLFFFSFFVLWFGAREINWKMHLMIFQICFQPHAQLYASGPRQMQISWGVKGRMRHAPHSNCNCNNCRNGMLYIYIVP